MINSRKTYKLFVLFFLFSCTNPFNTLEGTRGFSDNINESRKNGTFLCAYSAEITYNRNDSMHLKILQAFVEHGWGYGNSKDSVLKTWRGIQDECQLILVIDSFNFGHHYGRWSIEQRTWGQGLRASDKNTFITEFRKECIEDTLVYYIRKGVYLKSDAFDENIIGKIVLIKKD